VSTGYRQLLLIFGLGLSLVLYAAVDGSFIQKSAAETLVHSGAVSLKPMLRWHKVAGAVSYEIELFNDAPGNNGNQSASPTAFYSTKKIHVTGFNADLSADFAGTYFYWRVRGLDVSGAPLGDFSEPKQVMVDRKIVPLQKPIPTSVFNQSPGSTLLYPVYAWIPVAGATEYEVEILAARPENPNGVVPSMHRIDSGIAVGFDYYDEKPRQSQQSFWWRVRGLDRNGDPVGVYSDAGEFLVNPRLPVTVATFGDSITHGGGDVSYSPADWEYSYQNYLMFPTINLGRSSDTSETMAARFERDVLPFRPQYLLIMGGTNSLRAGVSAQSVIEDLMAIKEKALANEISPVFLTIPPINPANISSVFAEPTVHDWQRQFELVNDFIRTQQHIDVTQGLADSDGNLLNRLGIDGLHLGVAGKRKIAAAVNANWRRITEQAAPMAQMLLQDKQLAD